MEPHRNIVEALGLLSESFPPEVRGVAFSVRMTGVRLGFTLGPLLGGYLHGSLGPTSPFSATALLFLLSIPIALTLREGSWGASGDGSG